VGIGDSGSRYDPMRVAESYFDFDPLPDVRQV
jgi:hypothetical protein